MLGAQSMILAAGKGKRMGTMSETVPKPLVPVCGTPMLDRTLSKIAEAELGPTLINVHHLADRMEAHLTPHVNAGRVLVSDERDKLLETGGGIAKALPKVAGDRLLVINGDAVWTDGAKPTLRRIYDFFDPDRMDMLLLAVPTGLATGYDGKGDIVLGKGCRSGFCTARLRGDLPQSDHMFGGIMMVRTEIYRGRSTSEPWSNRALFEQSQEKGRLFAVEHRGNWMHVGTPEGVEEAERQLGQLDECLSGVSRQ